MPAGAKERAIAIERLRADCVHGASAESDVSGADVSGAAPLECREIPAPAIGPGFVAAMLNDVTLHRTRQKPPVDLGFSQEHGRTGAVEVAAIVTPLCFLQNVTYIGPSSASA